MQIDGQRLRMRRNELRLSQLKLEEISGVDQSIISKIERGQLKGRERDQQDALAKALGITVQELCGEAPGAKTPTPSEVGAVAIVDAGVVDDALGAAWDPRTHRVVDLLVARALVIESGDRDVPEGRVLALLNAVARIRVSGRSPTAAAVAMELTGAVPPSAETKPAKKTRAA